MSLISRIACLVIGKKLRFDGASVSYDEDREYWHRPLLPIHRFIGRLLGNFIAALLLVAFSLGVGMWGYNHFEGMNWTDAFLNASMILGGMGPVDKLATEGGKIFAGCYALYSGVVLLFSATLLLAPIAHRVVRAFHLADTDNKK